MTADLICKCPKCGHMHDVARELDYLDTSDFYSLRTQDPGKMYSGIEYYCPQCNTLLTCNLVMDITEMSVDWFDEEADEWIEGDE